MTAIASMSFNFLPLFFKALFTIKSILSIWDLAVNSGTTPPNFLCISSWLETIFDKILGIVPVFSSIKAAAVSTQLVSIPRNNVFFLMYMLTYWFLGMVCCVYYYVYKCELFLSSEMLIICCISDTAAFLMICFVYLLDFLY